jgi:hypothetical protein
MIGDDKKAFHDKDGNLEALGGNEKEFHLMLKYELHFTYYHQAEALFELIFALEKVISESKYVWLEMSNFKPGDMKRFAKKVSRLAEGSNELKAKKISLTDGSEISFYEWLIFDVFVPEIEIDKDRIDLSTEKVNDIIKFTAKDLSEKNEYNAFKHGMRVLHLFSNFSIKDQERNKFAVNFDLTNSFTHIIFPKGDEEKGIKKGDVQAVTKGYNPKQDLLKIKLITFLMGAIIEIRKNRFFGKGKVVEFLEYDISKKLYDLRSKTDHITFTLHTESRKDDK